MSQMRTLANDRQRPWTRTGLEPSACQSVSWTQKSATRLLSADADDDGERSSVCDCRQFIIVALSSLFAMIEHSLVEDGQREPRPNSCSLGRAVEKQQLKQRLLYRSRPGRRAWLRAALKISCGAQLDACCTIAQHLYCISLEQDPVSSRNRTAHQVHCDCFCFKFRLRIASSLFNYDSAMNIIIIIMIIIILLVGIACNLLCVCVCVLFLVCYRCVSSPSHLCSISLYGCFYASRIVSCRMPFIVCVCVLKNSVSIVFFLSVCAPSLAGRARPSLERLPNAWQNH